MELILDSFKIVPARAYGHVDPYDDKMVTFNLDGAEYLVLRLFIEHAAAAITHIKVVRHDNGKLTAKAIFDKRNPEFKSLDYVVVDATDFLAEKGVLL